MDRSSFTQHSEGNTSSRTVTAGMTVFLLLSLLLVGVRGSVFANDAVRGRVIGASRVPSECNVHVATAAVAANSDRRCKLRSGHKHHDDHKHHDHHKHHDDDDGVVLREASGIGRQLQQASVDLAAGQSKCSLSSRAKPMI